MDKRGVDLTLNTIVIAVLVVLVLIVLIVFFLGGFEKLTEKIKQTRAVTTAGTDITLAVQACEQYCGQAQLLPKSLLAGSEYCSHEFKIEDREGTYVCSTDKHAGRDSFKDLGVTCAAIECGVRQP